MELLMILKYVVLGLSALSFLMFGYAIRVYLLTHKATYEYTYINTRSVLKSIVTMWCVIVFFMFLKLISIFSIKNCIYFSLIVLGVSGLIMFLNWLIREFCFGIDKHDATSVTMLFERKRIAIFSFALFVITTVLAFISYDAISSAISVQSIDNNILLGIARNIILMVILMYCRFKTFSTKTVSNNGVCYMINRVDKATSKYINIMNKNIKNKGEKAYNSLVLRYKRFCKKYSKEAGETLLCSIMQKYKDDKLIVNFVKIVCKKYRIDLEKVMENGASLFVIHENRIEGVGRISNIFGRF